MPRRFYNRNINTRAISFWAIEMFKFPIGISVFGSEIRIMWPIAPKVCIKNDLYIPHLSSNFQVSTLSRFQVIAFSNSGCRIRNFAQKKA